jgi:NitT/TauT family transport system substrate-binding protein
MRMRNSFSRPLSRRAFLRRTAGASAGLATGLAMPFIAHADTEVTLTLPWVAEGTNLVAFVAKGNGYWSKNGLNVTISRGYGSVAAAEAVGAGKFNFGLAAASAGIQQSAKGLPIIHIACTGYDATMGVAVLEDSPIQSPKDLEGKQMASTITSGEYPFLPIFAKNAGFDLTTVKSVAVDPNVRERLLIEHKVDAVSGFAMSMAPVIAAAGAKARFMLYSKYGLPLYHNTLMTQPAYYAANTGICEAMAEGLVQAMQDTLLDPKAAAATFFKQVPEMALTSGGAERIRIGLGIYNYQVLYPPARSHGLGYADPKDFEAMTDLVMKYVAGPGDARPKLDDILTNRFVGKLKLSDAQWAQAEAGVSEFKPLLS